VGRAPAAVSKVSRSGEAGMSEAQECPRIRGRTPASGSGGPLTDARVGHTRGPPFLSRQGEARGAHRGALITWHLVACVAVHSYPGLHLALRFSPQGAAAGERPWVVACALLQTGPEPRASPQQTLLRCISAAPD